MLIAVTYPGILGDKAPASNSGKFEAKGYEGTLTWSDKIGKVNYHIGGTFTYADNKLVDYGGVTVFKSGFIDKQQGYFPKFSVWIEVLRKDSDRGTIA